MKRTPMAACLVLVLLGTSSFAGCLGPADDAEVLASFYPLEFLAARIAGDNVSVGMVVGEGNEPHDWQPAPRDVVRLDRSRLVVALGLGFEPWLEDVLDSLGGQAPPVIATAEGLDPDHAPWDDHEDAPDDHDDDHDDGSDGADGNATPDPTDGGSPRSLIGKGSLGTRSATGEDHDAEHDQDPHDHGGTDPHVWLDPVLMAQQAERVRDGLIATFPDHEDAFEIRAAALIEGLHDLHEAYEERLEECATRVFVTEHDAFSRLASRYGLQAESLAGLDAEAEVDARRIDEVIRIVRDHEIPIVFGEQGGSGGTLKAVAGETGAELQVLHTVEYRTPQDRSAGADYLLLMYDNLDRLVEALGCR